MSFLIPLGIMAAGKIGSNLLNKRTTNKNVDYQNAVTHAQEDQRNKDYTARTNTQNNGIDYLQAVAAAHGYNIPQVAFDAAHRLNGVTGPLSASERFANMPDAPKAGLTEALLGPIFEGAQQYGGIKLGQSQTKAGMAMNNANSITQAIIQGVIDGKIDPSILQQLGIGGFDRILQQLQGGSGGPASSPGVGG